MKKLKSAVLIVLCSTAMCSAEEINIRACIPQFLIQYKYLYEIILITAVVISLLLVYKRIIKIGFERNKSRVFIAFSGMILLFSTFVGSHFAGFFYYPFSMWRFDFFLRTISKNIYTYHAGLITAFFLISLLVFALKFDYFKIFDISFLYLPVAHAIGRVSCFILGCCWGSRVSITIFGRFYEFINPVPLYSIILNIILFIILKYIFNRVYKVNSTWPTGIVGATYFIFFGLGRYVIEFYRIEPVFISGLTQAQFISIILFVAGVIIIAVRFFQLKLFNSL